jgi:serine protease Do
VFDFDYDLTLAIFFFNPDGRLYARYGGRGAEGPDARQSPEGLRHTMTSVLEMHGRAERRYAPRAAGAPLFIGQLPGAQRHGHCLHCHQVKEALHDELRRTGAWWRDMAWRYPVPERAGFRLDVARGNIVADVLPRSAAASAGVLAGDRLLRVGDVPIHSQADVQFALDRAPASGTVTIAWQREGQKQTADLQLPQDWRHDDITWRPSLQMLIPYLPLDGSALSAAEKEALGLPLQQFALRHGSRVHSRAQDAGIRAGDIVLGIDGRTQALPSLQALRDFVRVTYLAGDRVAVELLRDGRRLHVAMVLP